MQTNLKWRLNDCYVKKRLLRVIFVASEVSIDSILTFFMPFCTEEYISNRAKFLPYPSPPTFWAPKLFFYIFKHNVPLWLALTFPNSSVWKGHKESQNWVNQDYCIRWPLKNHIHQNTTNTTKSPHTQKPHLFTRLSPPKTAQKRSHLHPGHSDIPQSITTSIVIRFTSV